MQQQHEEFSRSQASRHVPYYRNYEVPLETAQKLSKRRIYVSLESVVLATISVVLWLVYVICFLVSASHTGSYPGDNNLTYLLGLGLVFLTVFLIVINILFKKR